ncbi:MAG: sigma-70 family RNA polymerase sigma factor [Chloroflexi bacterium]|nr:sigma-70 family RNA polymerase sigma factor [Chloroflexota bacterium]
MKDNYSGYTDEALVEMARQDIYHAFEELVRRYQAKIYGHCYRMLGNRQDAMDCHQEAFLRAYKHLKNFRGDSSFSVWLYKIATNFCLMRFRKQKSRPKELYIEDLLPKNLSESNIAVELPDISAEPEQLALDGELVGVMEDAIRRLPEDYRATFILRDIEGFSTKESAKILKITQANVKSRLHRARLFLRTLIAPYLKEAFVTNG